MKKKQEQEVLKLDIRTKRIITTALIILCAYGIITNLNIVLNSIKKFINIINPFIYGVILGYLFLFPVRKLQKLITRGKTTKWDKQIKWASVLIVYVAFFAAIYFFMSWVLPFLYNAAIDILENMPQYLNAAEEWLKTKTNNKLLSQINIEEIFRNIRSLDFSKIMLGYLKGFNIQYGINALFSAAGAITRTFITIVVSFNIIIYSESLAKEIKLISYGILGSARTKRIKRVLYKINEVFVSFIYGQFLDSVVVAIIFTILFIILGIKHSVALGVLIGIGNLIPYVGAFLSIGGAFIVTCFTGGFTKGLLLLVISIVVQQIDAQIINPAIIGDQLDLNPPLIILAILIGGAYFGPIIVFLAAPVLAVLKSLLIEHIENKKAKIRKNNIKNLRKKVKLSEAAKYKQTFKFDYTKNYLKQQKENERKNKKSLSKPKVKIKK